MLDSPFKFVHPRGNAPDRSDSEASGTLE